MNKVKLTNLSLDSIGKIGLHGFNKFTNIDSRGQLDICFEHDFDLSSNGISIKESTSIKGVARGLHLQDPIIAPQVKIIEVLEGVILDFIYDPRLPETVYYFQLSDHDNVSIFIPKNFAHGFIALTDVRFRYTCLGRYDEANEVIYNILDSASQLLKLDNILLSDKDRLSPEILCVL